MTPRGSTILGRAQELALLDAQLDRARAGPAEPVMLVGEPGMGKSALLDALAHRGRGRKMKVVRTRSPSGADASPFALVVDVVRGLSEDLALLSQDDANVLRRAARDGSSRPGPVAGALLELLAESAHRQPILLLLDDLHWADRDSVAAVCLAAGRLQSERVAVVGAARPRPPLHPGLHDWDTVAISPLEMDPAVDVLRAHLPESMGTTLSADETRLRILAERLGKCPLALVEAGRLLSPEQLFGTAPLPDPMPIDEHLLTAWGTAWARLDPPARTAMLALCVTGDLHTGALAHLLEDLGRGPDDFEAARSERLVVADAPHTISTINLAHPLIRDAVLAAAGPALVRDMHRRAARSAETLGLAPSIIVTHLAASATPGDEQANAELLAQADRAAASGFGAPAGIALITAATLAPDAAGRAHLAARAAEVLTKESLASLDDDRILQLASAAPLAARERFWIEWLRSERLFEQDLHQARAAIESVATLAAEIDSPMRAWVEYSALTAAWDAQDGPSAVSHAAALRALADRPDAGTGVRMPAWACRAMHAATLFQVGQVRGAHAQYEVVRAESCDWDPQGVHDMSQRLQVLVVDGQVGIADPSVDARLDELARRLAGDPGETLSYVRAGQALRAAQRANLTLARSLMDDAFALHRGSLSRLGRLVLLGTSLWIGAREGDSALVRQQARELRAGASRIGGMKQARIADRAEGLIALAEGRVDEALLHLEPLSRPQLLGPGPWDAVPMGRADLVEALTRAGEIAGATEVATALQTALGPSPDPFARGLVGRVHGLVTGGDEARAAFEASAATFREAGDSFEAARSRLLLGELLRRERQIEPARRELRLAIAAFERMGAPPWYARAVGELRATRAAVPPPTPDPWTRLTPQERRVADAVAAGGTDRQVAAELFLSARTVGYHLASVYRKLGVANRTALAARLAQAKAAGGQAGPG